MKNTKSNNSDRLSKGERLNWQSASETKYVKLTIELTTGIRIDTKIKKAKIKGTTLVK